MGFIKLSPYLLILILSSASQTLGSCFPCSKPKPPSVGPVPLPLPLPPIPVTPVIPKPPITITPVIPKPPITLPPVITPILPPVITPIPILPPVITPILPPVITPIPILPPVTPILPPVTPILPKPPASKPACPPPPVVKPPCPPKPTPTPAPATTCPVDTLKLGACLEMLGATIHIGDPAVECCPLISGLTSVSAAACLCTTIKLQELGINLFLPIALELLVTCGKTPPPGYNCA